jgi:hypothetical protein
VQVSALTSKICLSNMAVLHLNCLVFDDNRGLSLFITGECEVVRCVESF